MDYRWYLVIDLPKPLFYPIFQVRVSMPGTPVDASFRAAFARLFGPGRLLWQEEAYIRQSLMNAPMFQRRSHAQTEQQCQLTPPCPTRRHET